MPMTSPLRTSLRALRYRNYRLFFIGQGVSLIGTWMQRVAMGWLVYRLSDSAFLLGLVGFTNMIPTFILMPIAGVLVDRWNRHRIIVATQTLAMVQAFILAGLVVTGLIQVWHIIVLGLLLGVVTAFDGPARQSFVVHMVDHREDLGNAIALNSTAFNIARLVGPSVAGALLALTGEWLCFLLNAVSFLAVIVALLMMKVPRHTTSEPPKDVLRSLKEGVAYTYANAPIRTVLVTLAIVGLMGMQYGTLMPVFARDILHGGPQAFGLLLTSTGCGALVGALYLASRTGSIALGRQIPLAIGLFGTSLVMFSLSHHLWLSLALMVTTGFGQIVHTASSNTVVQTIVDEDKRGRVMSLYMMAFMGTAPFGNLLAGWLASAIGAPNTLLVSGGACVLAALYFAWRLPSLKQAAQQSIVRAGAVARA